MQASRLPIEDERMGILDFVLLLVIAGVVGSLGQAIVGVSRGGCLVSIVLGFIGSLLGWWLEGVLGLPELLVIQLGDTAFPVVWAIIGSALFVAVISMIAGKRR